ncbi:MAG: PQQ-binding-like beta-propeller repeat protein [Thermoanaerobaculia bacterium]|nr:PQQ-binding-like beta-propeller repeat protein [Thermoanaerobaculia bacterium]
MAWKTRIPGLGHSSPVVWGERVFLTTAVSAAGEAELKTGLYGSGWPADDGGEQSWWVIAVDRRSGDILWQQRAHRGKPAVQRHPKASHANSTPTVDAERVVAFFGSEGLFCYDHDGELLWHKSFGVLPSGSYRTAEAQWGFGSSPVLYEGRVVIQADTQEKSFLAVLDAATGEQIWRIEREGEHPTWSTPTIQPARGTDDKTKILANGFRHMAAYELASGEELWRLSGGGDVPVPTPIAARELVFLTNAHGPRSPIIAVRQGARGVMELREPGEGEVSRGLAWFELRGGAYMQTPIVVGEELYVCRDNGVMSCYDADNGTRHYQERLSGGDGFTSSPVAADGKLYFTSETGTTHVVGAGTTFQRLAVNELGEEVLATPALADGMILIRGRNHLFGIVGTKAEAPSPSTSD